MAKKLIKIGEGIPLVGTIMFGVIDRGTNLLQIRATTVCPLNCIYCSVDSGNLSKTRISDYVVDLDYLLRWVKEIVRFKGGSVEANIDSVGEPLAYQKIVELVEGLRKIQGVNRISMQTNGFLLNEKLIDELENAGLNELNISFNTLDAEKAKLLSGCNAYDLNKVLKMCRYLTKSKIELLIAPVLIGDLNLEDMKGLISFAKEIGAKLGIQKFEIYKYGRKPKGVKSNSWYKFYEQLSKWEKEFGIQLKLSPKDFKIIRKPALPIVMKKNERLQAEIVCDGWMEGQMIAKARERCITVNNCRRKIGDLVNIKVIENKNNIYIGEMA